MAGGEYPERGRPGMAYGKCVPNVSTYHNEYGRMGNPFRKLFGQIVSLTGIDVWHWQRQHLEVNETREMGG